MFHCLVVLEKPERATTTQPYCGPGPRIFTEGSFVMAAALMYRKTIAAVTTLLRHHEEQNRMAPKL